MKNNQNYAEMAQGGVFVHFSEVNLGGLGCIACNADFIPITLHPCVSKFVGRIQIDGEMGTIKNWENGRRTRFSIELPSLHLTWRGILDNKAITSIQGTIATSTRCLKVLLAQNRMRFHGETIAKCRREIQKKTLKRASILGVIFHQTILHPTFAGQTYMHRVAHDLLLHGIDHDTPKGESKLQARVVAATWA